MNSNSLHGSQSLPSLLNIIYYFYEPLCTSPTRPTTPYLIGLFLVLSTHLSLFPFFSSHKRFPAGSATAPSILIFAGLKIFQLSLSDKENNERILIGDWRQEDVEYQWQTRPDSSPVPVSWSWCRHSGLSGRQTQSGGRGSPDKHFLNTGRVKPATPLFPPWLKIEEYHSYKWIFISILNFPDCSL